MSEIQIVLQPDQLKGLFEQALLASLDQVGKERIIAQAISYLTTQVQQYSTKTKLQSIFEDAVAGATRKTVQEMLDGDGPFRDQLRSIVTQAFDRVMETDVKEKLIANVADSIASAFKAPRTYD